MGSNMAVTVNRIILAVALLLLIWRYIDVLITGYDLFEGNNDPRADWVNYVAYTSVGFESARRNGVRLAIFAGTLVSALCVIVRLLLISAAWQQVLGWERMTSFWLPELWKLSVFELIIGTLAWAVCAL